MNVDKSNFAAVLPQIIQDVKECDFIAFDLEYSGIKLQEQHNYTLFDSIEDRYVHIRDGVKSFTTFQLGIVLFRRYVQQNSVIANYTSKFVAKVYNIDLFPFGSDFYDSSFICSAAALRFLRNHGMDINNIIDNGAGYLNKTEFNELKTKLDSATLYNTVSEDQRKFLESQRKIVSSWLERNKRPGNAMELETMPGLHVYFHQMYLRSHFIEISTAVTDDNLIVIETIKTEERYKLDELEDEFDFNSEKYKFCFEMLGVTKLWKLISRLQKPIVGHNCLYDIVAIYQKFFDNLPDQYKDFRFELNKALSSIFDTKFVFGRMRMNFKELTEIEGGLEMIYNGLVKNNEKSNGLGILIELDESTNFINGDAAQSAAHQAGYDAYMTGCCLLYMANILFRRQSAEPVTGPVANGEAVSGRLEQFSRQSTKITLPSFDAYERLLRPWKNQVNVIRAREFCVRLDEDMLRDDGYRTAGGRKLLNRRPEWLVVYDRDPMSELVPCVADRLERKLDEACEEGDNDDQDPEGTEETTSSSTETFFCQAFLEQLLFEFGDADIRRLGNAGARDERKQRFLVAMTSHNVCRAFERRVGRRWPRLVIRDYCRWTDEPCYRRGLLTAALVSTVVSAPCLVSLVSGVLN